jgi:hypothetical protein
MRDSRPSKTRLQLRIRSINRQLKWLQAADADRVANFDSDQLTYRTRTNDEKDVRGYYSSAMRTLERLREEYKDKIDRGDYSGQPRERNSGELTEDTGRGILFEE